MTNVAEDIGEGIEEEQEADEETKEEPIVVIRDDKEYINYVVQRILLSPKQEDQS